MSETALALVQSITAVEFFKPGASKTVIESLKIEVRAQAAKLDISTEEGRQAIASLAFKVAKSKTGLDKAGKELVADQKAAIKRIDAERATVWDELEALQKEVRQPLTDFENAEKERIASHEAALEGMAVAGNFVAQNWQTMPIEDMRARLQSLTESKRDWQEFLARARQVVVTAIGQIKTAIAQREKLDADAAELEKLRAMAAAQRQKEHEENIAREAREEAEALARKREDEQRAAAEAERERVELERAAAEARAKQAEAQREQEAAAAAESLRAAQEQARFAAEEAERTRLATEEAARQAEARRMEDEARFAKESHEAAQRHAEHVRLAEEEKLAATARASYAQLHAVASARYNDAHMRIIREESAISALDAKLLSTGVLKDRKKTAGNLKKAKDLDADIMRLTSEVTTKKAAISKMEELAARPECPTCGQAITAEVMATLVGPLTTAYSEAAQALRTAQDARKLIGDPEGAAREVEDHEQATRDMEAAKQRVQDDRRIQHDAEQQLEALTNPPTI